MLPHRSGSHETLTGRLKLVRVPPALPAAPELLPAAAPLPDPDSVIDGDMDTTGNSAARATPTAALACRYCASARRTFWFEMLTCSSSAFRAGSLYSSHHRPFAKASPGCEGFHPAASASLKFTDRKSTRLNSSHLGI